MIVKQAIQSKNEIMINANEIVKSIVRAQKIIFGILAHICENSKYLKSTIDESVTVCEEIINATDSVSTNMTNVTNTIPTIVTSAVSINSNDKKLRYEMDWCILHTFLLVITYYYL